MAQPVDHDERVPRPGPSDARWHDAVSCPQSEPCCGRSPLLTARTVPIAEETARAQSWLIPAANAETFAARPVQISQWSRGLATAGQPQGHSRAGGIDIWRCGPMVRGSTCQKRSCAAAEGEGISSILLEGGGHAGSVPSTAGLVDEIAWFRAPDPDRRDRPGGAWRLGGSRDPAPLRHAGALSLRNGFVMNVLDTYVRI